MSVELVQSTAPTIEFIVAPEVTAETPPIPSPVRTAIRAIDGGKYGLKHLQIENPITHECVEVTTMFDNDGKNIFEVIAPNGVSYWTTTGEHICGFHPGGTRPPDHVREFTPDEISAINDFRDPIWTTTPRRNNRFQLSYFIRP